MNISIFGLGYVGAVSLACLARDGHRVIGVDIDEGKLDLIRRGAAPIVEEGIQETMAQAVESGRVKVTSDCKAAVAETDLSFVCVGTPSQKNGGQDLTAIDRLTSQLGEALAEKDGYHVIVIRSTVQPGTVNRRVRPLLEEASGKKAGVDFDVCFQPEFLREGSSIRDYDNPPFTVIGTDSERAAGLLQDLFGHLPCEFIRTEVGTAEMLKYACNAFHALKVTFANEIGRIAQSYDVDSHEAMALVCQDTRLNISPAYLRPGFAFGGSCLPKDVRALVHLAQEQDLTVPMLGSLLPSNRAHIDHVADIVKASGTRRIGFVGLSFKSGTDDLRESPLVTMAEHLIGKGYELSIYDPEVHLSRLIGANRAYIEQTIPHIASLIDQSLESVLDKSDVIVVGLSDAEVAATLREALKPEHVLVDLVGLADRDELKGEYHGACW